MQFGLRHAHHALQSKESERICDVRMERTSPALPSHVHATNCSFEPLPHEVGKRPPFPSWVVLIPESTLVSVMDSFRNLAAEEFEIPPFRGCQSQIRESTYPRVKAAQ